MCCINIYTTKFFSDKIYSQSIRRNWLHNHFSHEFASHMQGANMPQNFSEEGSAWCSLNVYIFSIYLETQTNIKRRASGHHWLLHDNSFILIWKRSTGRFLSSVWSFSAFSCAQCTCNSSLMTWSIHCHKPYTQSLYESQSSSEKNHNISIIYRVDVVKQNESSENRHLQHQPVFFALNISAY